METRPTLISRLRDGTDQASWGEFDRLYRDLILRYAARVGLQLADAEDVRQTVMLSLSRNLRTFVYAAEPGRFRSYLGRSVQNAAFDVLRKRGRRSETGLEEAAEMPAPEELDSLWEREWMDHHYRTALKRLKRTFEPRSMDVFEDLLAGASAPDVAAARGVTVDAVYKIKQRVKERLQEEIAAQISDTEFQEQLHGGH